MSNPEEGAGQAQQTGAPASTTAPLNADTEKEAVTINVPQSNPEAASGQSAHIGTGTPFCILKDGLSRGGVKYDVVLIVFIVLIFGGGVYGYIGKQSVASLAAGVVLGLLLAAGAYMECAHKNPYPLLVLLVFIWVMFTYRFAVSHKFMPSGLFSVLTFLLLARNGYILHLDRRAAQPATN